MAGLNRQVTDGIKKADERAKLYLNCHGKEEISEDSKKLKK